VIVGFTAEAEGDRGIDCGTQSQSRQPECILLIWSAAAAALIAVIAAMIIALTATGSAILYTLIIINSTLHVESVL
jgi:hypothetical protein